MIDLAPADLRLVIEILRQHVPDCEVRAFGSRLNGHAKTFSDLDLALVSDAPLDWRRLEALKDSFAESDLPIMIDVLDWHSISDEFKAVIEKNYEALYLQ